MAYDSGKRLLLYALVKGLGDAVRRNDQSAAKRYRRRLRLATEQIAADDPVKDALEKLLLISGRWVVAPVVTLSPKGEGSERYVYRSDRDEPWAQLIDHLIAGERDAEQEDPGEKVKNNPMQGRTAHHASHSPPYLGILLAVRSDSPRALPHAAGRGVARKTWHVLAGATLLDELSSTISPYVTWVCRARRMIILISTNRPAP